MVDRGGSVDVMLGLPSGVAAHDLSISGGADALRVTAHGQPQPLLEVLQLYSTVDPERTRHQVEDGRLVITLHKRDPSSAWTSLHAAREERQDQQVSVQQLLRRHLSVTCVASTGSPSDAAAVLGQAQILPCQVR
jgi:hypothetical protein